MTFEPPDGSGKVVPNPTGDATEGWWEEPGPWWMDERGFEEGDGWAPFPRRRRSRVLQVTGIVVAAALVLASASATVEVILGRSTAGGLQAEITSVVVHRAPSATGRGATTSVRVAFQIKNGQRSAVVPVCLVSIVDGDQVVATTTVGPPKLGTITHGTRTVNHVTLDVLSSALSGSEPTGVIVCHADPSAPAATRRAA